MARTLSPPSTSRSGVSSPVLDLDRDLERASAPTERRCAGGGKRVVDEYRGTGRIGRIARAFLDETTFIEETTLERRTDRNRDERAVVLRHRRIPGSRDTIDHIVVAPSGIWVIEAITTSGKVAQRNVGGWFKQEPRLYVSDKDQTALLAAVERKSEAIERIIETLDVHGMSVDRAACFTSAEWPRLFAKPLRIADVWVTWPNNLVEMIIADGPLDVAAVRTVSDHLNETLKPA
jgi:hypothetical protein